MKTQKLKLYKKPLINNLVMIEPDDIPEKSSDGLYFTDSEKLKPAQGTVIGVSKYVAQKEIKQGTRFVYRKNAGTEVTVEGRTCLVMPETELMYEI